MNSSCIIQSVCNTSAMMIVYYFRHVQAHKDNADNMCELCGKCFHKVQQLRLHRFNKHKVTDPRLKVSSGAKSNPLSAIYFFVYI